MPKKVEKLFELLTSTEKRDLSILFGIVLVTSFIEVTSIASILPFLSVAANPESIQNVHYLKWAFDAFGFTSEQNYLIALGLAAFAVIVISNGLKMFKHWFMWRFVWKTNHRLSVRLLKHYLAQSYRYFLTRNTAKFSKNIIQEANQLAFDTLKPVIVGASNVFVAAAISGLLFYIDPFLAFLVTVVLGLSYGLIYYIVRRRLEQLGRRRLEVDERRYQILNESFGGIKPTKLHGKEQNFVEQYIEPSEEYAEIRAEQPFLSDAPKHGMEAVIFGGLVLITIYLLAIEKGIGQVIPVLGVYAFAGYRLMPALQRIFRGIARLRYQTETISEIYSALREEPSKPTSNDNKEPIELNKSLQLKNVSFKYPKGEKTALKNISVNLPASKKIGIVGRTGAGKTTLVDILLGLLRPDAGELRVDDIEINGDNIDRWQKSVGYVPQQIYLADTTVAENIAFGVSPDRIESDKLVEAARKAQILDFIENELPDGFETTVGERGIQLSGGQRQRIGIARALYREPSVLIFDEATSNLDTETEQKLMDAIYELGESYTLILVSHRLRTVEQTDKILFVEDGNLLASDTFENLKSENRKFQRMLNDDQSDKSDQKQDSAEGPCRGESKKRG